MNEKNPQYPARIITKSTASFALYQQELQRSESLISYLEVGSQLISKNSDEAKQYYTKIYDHVFNPELARKSLNKNINNFLDVEFYETHLSSMIYVNTIDNFTTYFKDILSEIVLAKPQILKSQESEKLDFILGHETMDELINSIANKKIEELFYKGIEDIEKFFKDRLGIKIFKNDAQRRNINFFIKQRNLTVHNRRKISKEFAKQFPEFKDKIGLYLNFEFKYVSQIILTLFNFIGTLDEEISKKFKLKIISSNI